MNREEKIKKIKEIAKRIGNKPLLNTIINNTVYVSICCGIVVVDYTQEVDYDLLTDEEVDNLHKEIKGMMIYSKLLDKMENIIRQKGINYSINYGKLTKSYIKKVYKDITGYELYSAEELFSCPNNYSFEIFYEDGGWDDDILISNGNPFYNLGGYVPLNKRTVNALYEVVDRNYEWE